MASSTPSARTRHSPTGPAPAERTDPRDRCTAPRGYRPRTTSHECSPPAGLRFTFQLEHAAFASPPRCPHPEHAVGPLNAAPAFPVPPGPKAHGQVQGSRPSSESPSSGGNWSPTPVSRCGLAMRDESIAATRARTVQTRTLRRVRKVPSGHRLRADTATGVRFTCFAGRRHPAQPAPGPPGATAHAQTVTPELTEHHCLRTGGGPRRENSGDGVTSHGHPCEARWFSELALMRACSLPRRKAGSRMPAPRAEVATGPRLAASIPARRACTSRPNPPTRVSFSAPHEPPARASLERRPAA